MDYLLFSRRAIGFGNRYALPFGQPENSLNIPAENGLFLGHSETGGFHITVETFNLASMSEPGPVGAEEDMFRSVTVQHLDELILRQGMCGV
jgi:hypothetical protein